jgi:hypothetical protein
MIDAVRSAQLAWLLTTLGVATSCADAYYVSLGGNAAELASDAAAPASDAGIVPICTPSSDELIPGSTCGEPEPPPDRCRSDAVSVSVASDCSGRRVLACPEPTSSRSASREGDALDTLLTLLLRQCGDEPNALRVRFESGCATSFALDVSESATFPALPACVAARLEAERYACAENVACGVGDVYGVPTSWVAPDWY